MQYTINRPVNLPVLVSSLTPTLTVTFLLDGVVVTLPWTSTVGSFISGSTVVNSYITFTPTTAGNLTVIVVDAGWTAAHPNATSGVVLNKDIEIVAKTNQDFLKNLEDESLGSWTWDKNTGNMTLLRQNGTQLATFKVSDTLSLASRERIA